VIDDEGNIKAVLEAGQQRLLKGDRVILVHGPAHEVAVVRRIFRLFLDEGRRQGQIADLLNGEGEPAEAGRPWNTWTVGQVLSNPKYAGAYRFGRSQRGLDGRRRYPKAEHHQFAEGALAPIVPLARIEAANARRDRRMLFLPPQEILPRLKQLAIREGYVTVDRIARDPTLPSPRTVAQHLGPLNRLNARTGRYPTRAARNEQLTFLPGHIDQRGARAHAREQDLQDRSMTVSQVVTCTAFVGDELVASGAPGEVALALKAAEADTSGPMPLVFNDATGEVVELDLRGSDRDILARLGPPAVEEPAPARGRGRPKMGVVAREITLMPKHWDWLAKQPGGASATLRRLVEAAAKVSQADDAQRAVTGRAYKVMYALAGHLPGYEAASRSLFAADFAGFAEAIGAWPADVRAYLQRLLTP
jgi:hypothetical protein